MYDHYNFDNSHIIKPPSTHFDKERKSQRRNIMLHIDSRDRDMVNYPHSNKYVIQLEEDVEDVLSAEIMYASIPVPFYTVHENNNRFRVTLENNTKTVTLDIGNYTKHDIATELHVKLRSIFDAYAVGSSWNVTYNERTDKINIVCNEAFVFDFTGSAVNTGKMLGFLSRSYASKPMASGTHEIVPPFRVNLFDTDYALLQITGFHNYTSVNNALKKTFAVIPMANSPQTIISESFHIQKNFNPPLAKMSKISVEFKDRSGKPFDLQNFDHFFILRLELYRHSQRYASFIDIQS